MIEFVEVTLGSGGGVACARCSRTEPARYREAFEIAAEVEAAVAAWGPVPGPNVALTGPDPFAHPGLPRVLEAAVAAGVRRLRLDTDGVALADGTNAAGILAAGVRHVRVTLLAGAEIRAPLAGVLAFAEAARAADVRVALSARIPVCRHDSHELPAAVAAAAEAGVRHVLLDVADPGLDVAGAMPWIAAACDTGTVACVWVEAAGVPYCLAGDHALHLVPVLRAPRSGEKADRCATCRLDGRCGGVAAGTAPQVKALLAPPAFQERLAESIRRAYLVPGGPGEVE